jgi:hypothetical protein
MFNLIIASSRLFFQPGFQRVKLKSEERGAKDEERRAINKYSLFALRFYLTVDIGAAKILTLSKR